MDFTDHPFLNVMWTMFIIWIWVAWFWLLIMVFGDVFRRHDLRVPRRRVGRSSS